MAKLSRQLGLFDAAMIVVSAIIGSGIFINPYLVARLLPTSSLILSVWVFGGVLALIGALAYAELGERLPLAGGQYVYLREAIHPLAGFLYGWALLLVIESGAIAAVAVAFASYVLALVPLPVSLLKPISLGALVVVTGINYAGLRPGRLVNDSLTLAKLLIIGAVIAIGLSFRGAAPAMQVSALAPAGTGFWPLAGLWGAAMLPVMFACGGWQNLNYVTSEMRRPERDLLRALLLGTGAVVAIYLLVNYVYLRVLGPAGLAATVTPAQATAAHAFGPSASSFMAGAIVLSTFAFLNLAMLAPPRVYYAMAADGLFFRRAASVHVRFHVPGFAILIQSGWAALLLLSGTYADLVNYVAFADSIFFGLTVFGLFVFRRRDRTAAGNAGRRSFHMPLYPWAPALFVLAECGIVGNMLIRSPRNSLLGVLLILTGVPVYYYWRRRSNAEPQRTQSEQT